MYCLAAARDWDGRTGMDGRAVRRRKWVDSVSRRRSEDELEGLPYTIVDIHFPGRYGLCRNHMLHFRDGWTLEEGSAYREEPSVPQGVDEVWQLYRGGTPQGAYVLCWGNRLVALEAPWLLSDSQMAAAAAQLAPL